MSLTFASNLTKMIDAGLGGEMVAPDTSVAVGHRMQYNLVSGPVASWNDPEGGLPINIVTEFGPIQAGTGDPSPENVRPISGRQSVTVTRAGVNLWDEEWELGYYQNNGTPAASNNRIRSKNRIYVKPSTTYYVNASTNNYELYVLTYDANGTYINKGLMRNITFTTSADAHSILFYVVGLTTYNHDISINYPSTDHDYHPGTVASVEVQLGQTVYGGRLNVTTGVMTVEWANIASYDGETLPGEWISDRDVYAPGTTPTTGAQVCYKLAEPLTVQLSPQTIEALKGQNNVWSDAGDVSVTWKEKLYTEGY